ncbi:MAG TPA: sigma-70 family RNA polymerase sigma factor [Phycisphaerae bacterium]|nr:sigma-70 family RNA polymerase sigma factor [Phycisphaerae bacterium]
MSDVTQILQAVERGEPRAAGELLPLVYGELRRLARERMLREGAGQTLQGTALVHEAYLRLVGNGRGEGAWAGRAYFFGAAAEAMRRILIENARRKGRERHGGGWVRVAMEEGEIAMAERGEDVEALDEALARLEAEDKGKAELVKLRYFAGLTLEEAGQMLGISPATADRHWAFARAWLYREMRKRQG